MKLIIIGLGNPGPEYANTYHNIGHIFVDFIADPKKRFKKDRFFLYQDCNQNILVKTAVYMNESGRAIRAALRRFTLERSAAATFMVVHDDSDIVIGNYKLSTGGGAAGHKGVESIIRALGYPNFKRLRIGIRQPAISEKASALDEDGLAPLEAEARCEPSRPLTGLVRPLRRSYSEASRSAPKRAQAGDFVLRNISKSDRATLHSVFKELKRSVIEKVA